jgi:SH3 domain protein
MKANNKMTRFSLQLQIFILGFCLLVPSAMAETVRYISDDLTVPMRSGTTIRHKILKFLNSGTQVKVLEKSEDGNYARVIVSEDGREGWVKTEYLMKTKSGRDRLLLANQKIQANNNQIQSLKQTIDDLKKQNQAIEDDRKKLMDKNNALQSTLSELRKTASKPIAIHEQNKALEAQIEEVSTRNKQLISENAKLNDKSLKEWFIIGAVVALGSLILGLIIPSIKWRKKDSWA